jgi:hypothetical protein
MFLSYGKVKPLNGGVPMALTRSIAESFFQAAEEALEERRREEAEARDQLRQKLGRVVDRYAEEVEPFVLAIARLPERAGHFDLQDIACRRSSLSMGIILTFSKGAGDKAESHKFEIDAMEGLGGTDAITVYLQDSPKPGEFRNKTENYNSFAAARARLAKWLVAVAPESLPDLKAALLPEAGIALGASLRVDKPLQFKSKP